MNRYEVPLRNNVQHFDSQTRKSLAPTFGRGPILGVTGIAAWPHDEISSFSAIRPLPKTLFQPRERLPYWRWQASGHRRSLRKSPN